VNTAHRLTDGPRPRCALDRRQSAYPVGASLEEMTETALLLDAALDDADPNDGDIDAWLRHTNAPRN